MNMISTGAFQSEMDASNKQTTLAEKFAAVWEKKNAKAARAGGLSLMALSLAACGSDDTTTTATTTTTTTTTDTTTTTTTPVAVTKVFTTAVDVLTGDGGDDTFIGDSGTTSAADSVDGGAGSDTLKIYGQTTLPSVSNVESIEVHHGTAASYNILNGDLGTVTSITMDGATINDTTVTLGNNETLVVRDATGANKDINITGSATATLAANVILENSGDSTNAIDLDITGTLLDTINLTSQGANALNYANIKSSGTPTFTTVNVTATGLGLVLEDVVDATTIDASASTAPVTLDSAVAKVTVTGGSGVDTITMDHGATASQYHVSAGAGNDTVTITSATAAAHFTDSKVTLDGGAGTDTLTMKSAAGLALGALTTTAFAKKGISNFEKLALSDTQADGGSYSIANFGVNHVSLAVDEADNFTITGVTSGFTLTTGKAVDDLGGTGSTDDLTITLTDRAGDGDIVNLDIDNTTGTSDFEFAMGEVEIVNIDTSGSDQANVVGLNTAQLKTINVTTATGNVTIDMSATGNAGLNVATVDASSSVSTGGVIFTADATNLAGITFKGGTGGDEFNGGDLSDVFTGGSGSDTIDVGAGGANTVDLSAGGSDTIEINSLTGVTTVTGFATGDIIDVEAAIIDGGEAAYTGQIASLLDLTDQFTLISGVNSTGTALLAGGSQSIADFTDMTDVAAYLEEALNILEAENVVAILNDGTNSYVYKIDVDADTTTDNQVDAGDTILLMTVNDHILVAADVTQS